MIPGTLARRYAQALLSLATSAPQRDRFARDMAAVANIVQQRDEAGRTPLDVLSADRFPADQRKKLLQTLARRVMVDPIVLRFLEVVFDRQRIDGLPQIARTYQRLADQAANRVQATLTSATPLSPESVERIKSALERALKKTVVPTTAVDPELIGGVVAKVGSLVIDGSVRSTLAQLRTSMRE